jgi:hypothetical protein
MTHLREIIIELADAKVDFVIGGGVACVLQGVERFTLDLDVAVNLTPANLERFIAVMASQGLVPRVPVEPESLLDPDVRKVIVEEKNALVFTFIDLKDPRRHVDMFLRDDLSYEVLNEHCDRVDFDGRKVAITSVEKLLEIKEAIDPPRDKDQLDIAVLRRMLGNG